jgi:hypothetical protein
MDGGQPVVSAFDAVRHLHGDGAGVRLRQGRFPEDAGGKARGQGQRLVSQPGRVVAGSLAKGRSQPLLDTTGRVAESRMALPPRPA